MTPDRGPTARALTLLELLQNNPGATAEQLARRLDVSSRAVRRYVEILREADIPVESIRGPGGGYRLGRGVRLPPLVFSAPEAIGLVMAALDGHHAAADPDDPVGSALGKLLRGLPRSVAEQAEVIRRTAAAAPDPAAARPDPEVTLQLVQACADRRRTRIDYRSEAGRRWQHVVEPWSVVVRHSRWYLLGHSVDADAVRALRIDRIVTVSVLDEPSTVPEDLDPVATLEQHLARGWEYRVDVVFAAPADQLAPWLPRSLGELSPGPDGGTRLVATTSNPAWYAERLARSPVQFRIEQGPELRDAVRELGQRLLAAADGPVG